MLESWVIKHKHLKIFIKYSKGFSSIFMQPCAKKDLYDSERFLPIISSLIFTILEINSANTYSKQSCRSESFLSNALKISSIGYRNKKLWPKYWKLTDLAGCRGTSREDAEILYFITDFAGSRTCEILARRENYT